jgi:hypothetical protein
MEVERRVLLFKIDAIGECARLGSIIGHNNPVVFAGFFRKLRFCE